MKINSKRKGKNQKYLLLSPKLSELILGRLGHLGCTSSCYNNFRRLMIRDESSIKLSYSWFSMKPILVGQCLNKKNKVKLLLIEKRIIWAFS